MVLDDWIIYVERNRIRHPYKVYLLKLAIHHNDHLSNCPHFALSPTTNLALLCCVFIIPQIFMFEILTTVAHSLQPQRLFHQGLHLLSPLC